MILTLRRRHRRMFYIIGMLLPLIFIAGIAARKRVPTITLTNEIFAEREAYARTLWDRDDVFQKSTVRLQLLRQEANTNRHAIHLYAAKDFVKADLLVYWRPIDSRLADTIPDDAVLLGAFNSGLSLPVPLDSVGKPGVIVLYSLADHEIVAVSQSVTL